MIDYQQGERTQRQVKMMKSPHDAYMINSTAIVLPQDDIFAELDAIVPNSDL